MKIFHCDHCEHLAFFESTQCVQCGHTLAYLPDVARIGSLERGDDGLWRPPLVTTNEPSYRLCANYTDEQVCNWAVVSSDPRLTCVSCRLTRTIPDLAVYGHRDAWCRLEVAKRRLIYTLLCLKLPLVGKDDDPVSGLAFDFLADDPRPGRAPVLTGHVNGIITVNIAEADDVERERRRALFREPYRTLLGHFWHESGHYYWNRLIAGTDRLATFRTLFGDERQDYSRALRYHYDNKPAADWPDQYVSAYATAHPWEDWSETWAHYLQMTDTLETAAASGMSIRRRRSDRLPLRPPRGRVVPPTVAFSRLVERWYPLTYALNTLNRGLGLPDAYPIDLSRVVIDKLRFIHETVAANNTVSVGERTAPTAPAV